MKSASIAEIKRELLTLDGDGLREMCLRLAKYKKENKELLSYLLFEAHDEEGFVNAAKGEVADLFEELPKGNLYYVKKSLRKILRHTNRQIKYSGQAKSELELRIFFCRKVKEAKIPLTSGTVLANLYEQQLKKVFSALEKMPEDLQFDYAREIKMLS